MVTGRRRRPEGGDMLENAELIYSYTRQQAIEDGILIDITTLAQEAGIRYPVAITSGLFDELNPTENEQQKLGQHFTGRTWDLLTLFRYYAKRGGQELHFHIFVQRLTKKNKPKMTKQYVKAVCGPGDNHEPVITIMLPGED